MFTVKEILEITGGELICGNKEQVIENFSKDTRQIQENDMYIAIKGENFNGNKYCEQALQNNAIGCIIDEEINIEELKKYNKTIIKVENTIQAIQNLAKYKRQQYNIPVIAITGSVGKTSTKDIIASVLSNKFNILKTEGNFNNNIGLPLTLLKLKNHDAIVIEMGMNSLGEIKLLSNIAKPTLAIITNIGTSHIGKLGSRKNILKAKLEILEGMSENSTIIINNDNDLLNKWCNENSGKYNIITYGIENKSDFTAKRITMQESGSAFSTQIKDENYNIKIPIGGSHFIYNALCAITTGNYFNIDIEKTIKTIETIEITKKRMDVYITDDNIKIINDCYNSSYDSLKPVLEYLKLMEGSKKIAILGDVFELGEYSKEIHKKIGELIVENKVDILVTVGIEAKYICERAIELGMNCKNVYNFKTNMEAVEKINIIKKPCDCILVKASNGMKFNEIFDGITTAY